MHPPVKREGKCIFLLAAMLHCFASQLCHEEMNKFLDNFTTSLDNLGDFLFTY